LSLRGGQASEATLHGIEVLPASRLPLRRLKELRSRRHGYWHYTFDLGDGARVEASLPGGMAAHVMNRDILFGLIDDYFFPLVGKAVLDAACSSGLHSFELAARGARVTAIDIDQTQIAQARFVQSCRRPHDGDVTFHCQDLLTYQAPPASFDLVYCSGLFYHLRDLVGGAKKLYDLTRSGAVVHSCLSTRDGDVLELADSKNYPCCFDGEFSFVPTRTALKRILEYVGFREVLTFRSEDRVAPARLDALLPHLRDLYRHNTAYYVLRK
jgi:2-polyprenyl-3-methyl-5-hydroxy-6-metoxy-1,4-benzoquinol methylase